MTASERSDGTGPGPGSVLAAIGMVLDSASPSEVLAHLDVDERHHMSRGIVHGGIYATVIESVATIGATTALTDVGGYAVGVNNQTDFLRPHVQGPLAIVARPISQGRTLQLWQVELTNDQGKLISRGQVRLFNQYPKDAG